LPTPPFDPESLPVDALAGEAPLPPERLQAGWLRSRFAAPSAAWRPERFDDTAWAGRASLTGAAVLIALVQKDDGLHVLLTQRTAHLSNHGGQISFPGGRTEATDVSPVDTALRETEEEIGLARAAIEVLGVLPDYLTTTGYRVTPVVGLIDSPFTLKPDPNEVAEVFDVPLAFLMNGMHHQRMSVDLPVVEGQERARRSFYAIPYGRFFIWGVTAGILRNLFHFLRA
jgi:8-oxo-dGTP pyrophosphatase MutT (NUDIX family)